MDNKTEDKNSSLEEKAKDIHAAFLSEDEKEKIRRQVQKELDDENKKKLADDYKATLKSEAKKKALFKNAKTGQAEEGLVPIFIDLPKVSECIRLDGVAFYPGHTYNVTPAVRETIAEIMGRGQIHEDEILGRKDSNFLRRRSNTIVQQ